MFTTSWRSFGGRIDANSGLSIGETKRLETCIPLGKCKWETFFYSPVIPLWSIEFSRRLSGGRRDIGSAGNSSDQTRPSRVSLVGRPGSFREPMSADGLYRVGEPTMPAFDDTQNHHLLWPGCRMHFVVETPATGSGLWFPLRDMDRGDYLELMDDDELAACRQSVAYWNRTNDSKFTIRCDRAQEGTHICRRVV